MKKFFVFALLCGFVGMPAFAEYQSDDSFRLIGGKLYGCNFSVWGDASAIDVGLTCNVTYQTYGTGTINGESQGTHKQYQCVCGSSNDRLVVLDTNWCPESKLRKVDVNHARYELRGGGQSWNTPAAWENGCIYAECNQYYHLYDGMCLSQEEINQRKEMCDGKAQGTVENVTVEECKGVWANKGGVNAITACTKKCGKNANGAGVWKVSVTQCLEGYKVVSADSVACKYDNNGGNGGGNGGNAGNGGGNGKQCKYMGKLVNPGHTVNPADIVECKEVHRSWDGSDKIKQCKAICEDNGTMRWTILSCEDDYVRPNVGEKIACEKKSANGGNGSGNGIGAVSCKNDSSPNIRSQDHCVQGTTFKCGQKDKNGNCECGYCFKIINGYHITVGSCPEKIVTRQDCEKEGKDFKALAYGISEDWLPGGVYPTVTYEVCGECVAKSTTPGNTTPAKKTSFQKCLEERKGNKEGTACCYLPKNVATWDGINCNCVGSNVDFDIGADGRGLCKAKSAAPGATFNCDSTVLGVLNGWLVECAKNAQIVSIITQIKALCSSESRTADQFNTAYQTLLALNPGECVEQPVQVIQQPVVPTIDEKAEKLKKSRIKISDSHGALRGMLESFKVSVWKNEEGKFNTARLASDSIAAVVLGTTGALVTSHVVKKNQVENGFEDIKCTIGGQTVADWGDEFRVGIQ